MKGLYCVVLLGCGRQAIHIGDSGLPSDAPDVCAGCEKSCTLEYAPSDSRSHIEGGVDYPDAPPASGDHDPCWGPWGVHRAPLNDENWVHNLEHGGVVFLYNCPEGCAEDVDALTSFASSLPENTWIVTPYAALPTRFGAVAWNYRATSACLDLEAWASFYDYFVDNAPESVTSMPGGSCL